MSKLLYTRFPKIFIDYLFSLNKSIPCRSDSKLHNLQDDHPITKLLSITNGDYKFGMEVPDAMISDAIKKKARYKYYMAKKVESEKAKIVDKPEEQHVSPIKSGRGKGFMCYGNQVENVPNKLKKDVVPRKTRSLTIAEETVVDMYNEWGQKLKGPAVDDPAVQSLLNLRKGSKVSRLESLKQKKQSVTGEGLSVAHNKYYDSSKTDNDAILYSSGSDKIEESENETNDADNYDMDLSDDNPHGDDDVVVYGVFLHNKSTATPTSTYLSLTEMFPDENTHHIPSLSAKKIPYPIKYPQPSSLQAKEKKLMQKAKKNMRKFILNMSSDNALSAVTYTSISSSSNGLSWGIQLVNVGEHPKMDPYEEDAQQGQVPPLSPAYVPDPMELEEHVPVYVLEPEHPEYHAPSDDDIQVEDQPYADDASPTVESLGYIVDSNSMEEDIDEDSINYLDELEDGEEDDDEDPEEVLSKEHEPEDNDEDPEEDPNEEHEPKDEDTKEKEPSEGSDETKPFEEDETAITPTPPRHRGAGIFVRPQTPMAAST
ncbi:hypothetical protein Tco_0401954 [Tanacetum coccineum]